MLFWQKGQRRRSAVFVAISLLLFFCLPFCVMANEACEPESVSALVERLDTDATRRFVSLDGTDITEVELEEIRSALLRDAVIVAGDLRSENLRRCFRWITENVRYQTADNRAYAVFCEKKGVCQGMANLFKVFATLCDVPCLVLEGDTTFGAHAWNFVYLDGRWVQCDPTNGVWCEEKEQVLFEQSYTPMTFTPSLCRDESFVYYYQIDRQGRGGICAMPISADSDPVIPEQVMGFRITALMEQSRYGKNENVKTLTFSNTIRYIEGAYFGALPSLSDIRTAENGKYRCIQGVLYSENGDAVAIPGKVTSITLLGSGIIGKGTAVNLSSLETIVFAEGITAIEDYAVENCDSLKTIVLPRSIRTVGNHAFPKREDIMIVSDEGVAKAFAEQHGYLFRYETAPYRAEETSGTIPFEQWAFLPVLLVFLCSFACLMLFGKRRGNGTPRK